MSLRFRWLVSIVAIALLLIGCADAPVEEVGSNAGAATDTTAVTTAVTDLQAAIDKKEDVDVRLGRVVARAGGFLTAKQQGQVVKAFYALPDVDAIEQNYHAKSENLAKQLDLVKVDPEAIGTYGVKNLMAGYALVAKTPSAQSALQFGTDAVSHRIDLAGVSDDEILEQIISPSLASAYLAELLSTGEIPAATKKTISMLEKGTGTCLNIAGWLQRYNAFAETDLLAKSVGISSMSTVTSLRTIAGIIAIWKLGDDLAEGKAQQLVSDFLASAPTAVTGLASATAMYRRMILGAENTPIEEAVVKYTGKIATGIGIVMGGLALWNDAGKWNDSVDEKMRVIADVLSIGASVLVLTVTGPIGPLLATVALGLTLYADWLEGHRLAAQEQADVEACLPAAGLGPTLVKTMLASDPGVLKELIEDVKLSPTDMQWLLTVDPNVATTAAGPALQFVGLRITQKIFDLDPAETASLLHAAVADETDPDTAALQLDTFLRVIEYGDLDGDMTRDEALTWFDSDTSPTMQDPQKSLATAALSSARTYLETVN